MSFPFDDTPACPKCESNDIDFEYITPRHGAKDFLKNPIRDRDERLDLKCNRCGYDWEMNTSDQDADEEETGIETEDTWPQEDDTP
jgi:hypothetical protein